MNSFKCDFYSRSHFCHFFPGNSLDKSEFKGKARTANANVFPHVALIVFRRVLKMSHIVMKYLKDVLFQLLTRCLSFERRRNVREGTLTFLRFSPLRVLKNRIIPPGVRSYNSSWGGVQILIINQCCWKKKILRGKNRNLDNVNSQLNIVIFPMNSKNKVKHLQSFWQKSGFCPFFLKKEEKKSGLWWNSGGGVRSLSINFE